MARVRIFSRRTKMWRSASTAPFDRDLRLADFASRPRVIQVPCRRVPGGEWVEAATGRVLDIQPTHWREWTEPRDSRRSQAHAAATHSPDTLPDF
jgi:hypothetical protein